MGKVNNCHKFPHPRKYKKITELGFAREKIGETFIFLGCHILTRNEDGI